MKIFEIITEAPITDYDTFGMDNKPNNQAFNNPNDKKLITNKNYKAKLVKFFSKTPYNFRIFFVNNKAFGNYAQMNNKNPRQISRSTVERYFSNKESSEIINRIFQTDMNSSITVIYAGNAETLDGEVADNVQPITPWIAAHRIGHALDGLKAELNMFNFVEYLREEIHYLIETIYALDYDINEFYYKNTNADPYLQVAHTIGTQRSSRNKQLAANVDEFAQELFAQYLNSGTVTLNPFPKFVTYDGMQYHGNGTEATSSTELENYIKTSFEHILNSAVGKIFII